MKCYWEDEGAGPLWQTNSDVASLKRMWHSRDSEDTYPGWLDSNWRPREPRQRRFFVRARQKYVGRLLSVLVPLTDPAVKDMIIRGGENIVSRA
jgi:hypothetical protein